MLTIADLTARARPIVIRYSTTYTAIFCCDMIGDVTIASD